MSESKLESFQNKCLALKSVTIVGPLARGFIPPRAGSAIVAVDGGIEHVAYHDLSIGDGDSTDKEMDIKASIHKNQSDLALALDIIPEGVRVALYGFWGERLDHQLTVLGEISRWHQSRSQSIILHGPDQERLEAFQKGTHPLSHEGLFSILSLYEGFFTLSGQIRYPLQRQKISALSSHLLSNYAQGEFVVDTNIPFFLYYGEMG